MAVKNMKPPRGNKNVNKKKNNNAQVFLISQEIKFAKMLAGNEKKTRDKVLKMLKNWITMRIVRAHEFNEDDFMRIWKGLFYSVWMSDKPLIQEDLCESVSEILDLFGVDSIKYAVLFFGCFLKTVATEWYGLDQHRIDKFLMLVRRLIRAIFRNLRKCEWSVDACTILSNTLSNEEGLFASSPPIYARNALGLQLHIVDCWLEELAKVSEGNIEGNAVVELLRPFLQYMGRGSVLRLCAAIKRNIFMYLLRQTDLGLDYQEKTEIWRQMGCPAGGVDALQRVESGDDDDESGEEETEDADYELIGDGDASERQIALDARAGRVDVVLPVLPVEPEAFISVLRPLLADKASSVVHRRRVQVCIRHLQKLSEGTYPLQMEDVQHASDPTLKLPKSGRIANKLRKFEKKMTDEADELHVKGLNKKQRKRVLAKARERFLNGDDATDEGNDDAETINKIKRTRHDSNSSLDATTTAGEWQVEDSQPLISITKKKKKNNGIDTTDNAEVIKQKSKRNKKKRSAENGKAESNEQSKEDGETLPKKKKLLENKKLNESKNTVETSEKVDLVENTLKKSKKKVKSEAIPSLNRKWKGESKVEAQEKVVSKENTPKKSKKNGKIDEVQTPNKKFKGSSEASQKVVSEENTPKISKKVVQNEDIQTPNKKSKDNGVKHSPKSLKIMESAMKIKSLRIVDDKKEYLEKKEIKVNGMIKESPKSVASPKNSESLKKKVKTPQIPIAKKDDSNESSPKMHIVKTPIKNGPAIIKDTPKSGISSKSVKESPKNTSPKTTDTPKKVQKTPNLKSDKRNVEKTVSPKKVELNENGKRLAALENGSSTPKRVKIVLKNNTAQQPIDYYKSIRQSPNIPFDSEKKPMKTNLKPNSTPSPINPFFKKKTRLRC